MQKQDKIVINDYIEKDPLSEENLDKTLETVNEFRVLFPDKSIWLYTGYNMDDLLVENYDEYEDGYLDFMRKMIVRKCDVIVDGTYIDSQRDITLYWRGSSNQKVVDVKKNNNNKR